MDETDGRRFWINNVNRATIGDGNPERDFSLIRDDAVTAREFFVDRRWNMYNRNFIRVNLFCSGQRPIAHADRATNLEMTLVEPLQCFRFVMGNIDAGNA